jgi:hypothetical protein
MGSTNGLCSSAPNRGASGSAMIKREAPAFTHSTSRGPRSIDAKSAHAARRTAGSHRSVGQVTLNTDVSPSPAGSANNTETFASRPYPRIEVERGRNLRRAWKRGEFTQPRPRLWRHTHLWLHTTSVEMNSRREGWSMRIWWKPFNSELWLQPRKFERQGHRDTMRRRRHSVFDNLGNLQALARTS